MILPWVTVANRGLFMYLFILYGEWQLSTTDCVSQTFFFLVCTECLRWNYRSWIKNLMCHGLCLWMNMAWDSYKQGLEKAAWKETYFKQKSALLYCWIQLHLLELVVISKLTSFVGFCCCCCCFVLFLSLVPFLESILVMVEGMFFIMFVPPLWYSTVGD